MAALLITLCIAIFICDAIKKMIVSVMLKKHNPYKEYRKLANRKNENQEDK